MLNRDPNLARKKKKKRRRNEKLVFSAKWKFWAKDFDLTRDGNENDVSTILVGQSAIEINWMNRTPRTVSSHPFFGLDFKQWESKCCRENHVNKFVKIFDNFGSAFFFFIRYLNGRRRYYLAAHVYCSTKNFFFSSAFALSSLYFWTSFTLWIIKMNCGCDLV